MLLNNANYFSELLVLYFYFTVLINSLELLLKFAVQWETNYVQDSSMNLEYGCHFLRFIHLSLQLARVKILYVIFVLCRRETDLLFTTFTNST